MNPETFSDDLLDLQKFCERLEKFALVEHSYVEDGLVISLNAPFGSGKTTFLKMWNASLVERRLTAKETPLSISVNAWESDHCGDPLLANISALSRCLEEQGNPKQKKRAKAIRNAISDIGNYTVGIANRAAEIASGFDFKKIGKEAQADSDKGRKTRDPHAAFLEAYEARVDALKHLKGLLKEAFGNGELATFVFIDELDRCRPDYAVNYLETLKHVFDIRGIIFVLAVDIHQLKSSVAALFGPGLIFDEYFRKFVHRKFQLPRLTSNSSQRLIETCFSRYIDTTQQSGVRHSFFTNVSHFHEHSLQMLLGFELSIRQLQECFRILGHLAAADTAPGQLYQGIAAGSIFMSALSVSKSSQYHDIGRGLISDSEFIKFFKEFFKKERDSTWWHEILVGGFISTRDDAAASRLLEAFAALGWPADDNGFKVGRANVYRGWGQGFSLQSIYNKIEDIKDFGKN